MPVAAADGKGMLYNSGVIVMRFPRISYFPEYRVFRPRISGNAYSLPHISLGMCVYYRLHALQHLTVLAIASFVESFHNMRT